MITKMNFLSTKIAKISKEIPIVRFTVVISLNFGFYHIMSIKTPLPPIPNTKVRVKRTMVSCFIMNTLLVYLFSNVLNRTVKKLVKCRKC